MAAHTGFLIIDVQNAILTGRGGVRQREADRALDDVVMRIAGLIRRAHAASVPVLYAQHDGPPGHRLEPDTPGWHLRPEIAPLDDEPVFRKRASDSFFETPLEDYLRDRGITRLVIAGCMTPWCVDTACRRAVSLGFDVVLVADGHTTVDAAGLTFEQIIAHHNTLLDGFDAGNHEVKVVPAADVSW